MTGCWDASLRPDLSQGDLLPSILIGTAVHPKEPLKAGPTLAKGGVSWAKSATWQPIFGNGVGRFLARGVHHDAVVLTESCEIDKDAGDVPILVAPVFPLAQIQGDVDRANVAARKRHAFLPLDAVQGLLQPSYVDLRQTTYILRAHADEAHLAKKLSMNEVGIQLLQAQIVAFYTRLSLNDLRA